MEKLVKRIIRKMEYGERLVTSVIFCSMMAVVTAQIVMRYLFNSPLLWSEEFARYVYVWLVFIGSAYCVTQDKHVAVTLVTDRMPSMVRKGVKIVCNLLVEMCIRDSGDPASDHESGRISSNHPFTVCAAEAEAP